MLALYIEWHGILAKHIPKTLRYSLGIRIDDLFSQILEAVALAQFSGGEERGAHIAHAIGKNDALKFMLYALYELKGIDGAKLISLSEKAAEIGRMLYGWKKGTEANKKPVPR